MQCIEDLAVEELKLRKNDIIDNHVHFGECSDIIETYEAYVKMMKEYNYKKISIASLPYRSNSNIYDEMQNYNALLLKDKLSPNAYAYGGIIHNENETQQSVLKQAKELYDLGFDGFKTLEGKPNVRKNIGISLNNDVYNLFFEFMEKEKIPFLIHVGDIEILWHTELLPQKYLENKWFYDNTFKTNDELIKEAEGILKKYPLLHIIFAHFMFKANDIDYCSNLLEKYPNTYFDLTPYPQMYEEFSINHEKWKKFFEKYSDRIIYGTDNYDVSIKETQSMVKLVRTFLEKKNEEYVWNGMLVGKEKMKVKSFGLNERQLNKIYMENAEKLLGKVPKKVDMEKLLKNYIIKSINK